MNITNIFKESASQLLLLSYLKVSLSTKESPCFSLFCNECDRLVIQSLRELGRNYSFLQFSENLISSEENAKCTRSFLHT